MRKNSKGFMLVEVVITATVILTSMVGLYTGFNRLYNYYNSRIQYYNIDGIYATKILIDELLKGGINDFLSDTVEIDNFVYLIHNGECNADLHINQCNSVLKTYGIDNMLVAKYNSEVLNNITVGNQTFSEYRDYVVKYYDMEHNVDYGYIFLTEICDEKDCYYSNLRIR